MGFYSGNSGNIQFGDADTVDLPAGTGFRNSPIKITNWTLSTSNQLLDTTTLGEYDKTSVYGLRTTSGTLRLFYYVNDDERQSDLNNNSASWFIWSLSKGETKDLESTPVALRLYIDDKKDLNTTITYKEHIDLIANITSVSYGSNVGELVAVDVSFEANGTVVRNRL